MPMNLPRFDQTHFSLRSLATFALGALAVLGTVRAQEGAIVKSIDVQYVGNQTVAPERLLSHMSTQVGDKLTMAQVDEDVKSLYASGDVENVRILAEKISGGVAVIVVAQTRAVYGGVEFVGNTLIETSKLTGKVDLTVNKPIDEAVLQTAREEIQEMYRKKGFSEATVTYSIGAPTAEGYSKVLFTIDEGTQGVLRNLEFVGNSAFTAARLKEQMSQKEKSITTIFGKGGSTDPETLAQDVRAVEDFYRDNGYLNARVVNVSRMRVDAKHVDVIFTIEEGQTYQVDSIGITGITVLDMQNDVLPFLKTEAGQSFAGNKLKDDIKVITDQYGRRGFAEARVTPRLDDAGNGAVRVVLEVSEGRAYKVGQVHIEGNDKTKDHVIRRELPLEPGQMYDTTKTDVTQRRLENMNYFANVEIMPIDTSYIDEKDLLIRVVEKPTGTVNFGAGFSSIDNLTGFFEVTQTNFDLFDWPSFTGAGQRFRFSVRAGSERTDASISITEPWLFGNRLAFTTELYYRDLLFLSDQYDQTNYGATFSLRKSIGEFTYLVGDYRAEQVQIDAEPNASPAFVAEEGDFLKSSVGTSVVRDTRDNVFLPREGNKVSAGFEFAGLGGDVDDTIATISAAQYFTLPHDIIISLNGEFNHSTEGDHIFTRHFLGGANTLRGFDYRDVGPRDPVSGEVLGGNTSWYGTIEASIPVVEKIRFATFYDVGEVSDGPAGSIEGGLNSDWGVGLRLFVLGSAPVRLDYAFPLQTDTFNDEDGGRFQFTMGATF
ncbi:MAG: outer membrane protein assembly factor BamA [Verrucomicrobiia bacterium Tous-C2TDCM]|nr:MAG: outer membrane protein assembly factor BamA [Verrucomicrobiae bacterium Tous-C2TDCM]